VKNNSRHRQSHVQEHETTQKDRIIPVVRVALLLSLIIAAAIFTSGTLNETSFQPPTSGEGRHTATGLAKIKDASDVPG
jgi:hypothetical protein